MFSCPGSSEGANPNERRPDGQDIILVMIGGLIGKRCMLSEELRKDDLGSLGPPRLSCAELNIGFVNSWARLSMKTWKRSTYVLGT